MIQAAYVSHNPCFSLTDTFRGMETHCEDCLRVTVGTRPENEQFLKLLGDVVNELGVV